MSNGDQSPSDKSGHPTPRCDDLQRNFGITFQSYSRLWEFARQLERELAEERGLREHAQEGNAVWAKRRDEALERAEQAEALVRALNASSAELNNDQCGGASSAPNDGASVPGTDSPAPLSGVSHASTSIPPAFHDVMRSLGENRCYGCGWPLGACRPFDCSMRYSEPSVEHSAWLSRTQAMYEVTNWLREIQKTPIAASAKLTNEGGSNG